MAGGGRSAFWARHHQPRLRGPLFHPVPQKASQRPNSHRPLKWENHRASSVSTKENAQHRNHGPHRCGQDDDDRAHPLLHRRQLQNWRGARWRRDHGLHGAGAGAGHHDHQRGDDRVLDGGGRPFPERGVPGQHHRHARPRGLHHRGRAFAARPRRCDRGLRRCRRCGAPVGDRLAAGGPLPGPAHVLREQDGPRGCELRSQPPVHPGSPRCQRRGDAAPARRRGRSPGRHRRADDEGDQVPRRQARQLLGRARHPGRASGGRQGRARAPGRGGGRGRRFADGALPRGRHELLRGADPPRCPRRLPLPPPRPRVLRERIQEQGRPAASRRRDRLHAVAPRRAAGRGRGSGEPGEDAHPRGERRRSLQRAGVQDHQRCLRRQPDLHARLLRLGRDRHHGAQLDQAEA